jgi:hypothetical protein
MMCLLDFYTAGDEPAQKGVTAFFLLRALYDSLSVHTPNHRWKYSMCKKRRLAVALGFLQVCAASAWASPVEKSLAPGDFAVVTGDTKLYEAPPGGFLHQQLAAEIGNAKAGCKVHIVDAMKINVIFSYLEWLKVKADEPGNAPECTSLDGWLYNGKYTVFGKQFEVLRPAVPGQGE